MPLLEILSAGASILGGLAGLKKQKPLSPRVIIDQTAAGVHGQAKGARDAGAKYGFNPLTLLGLGGAGVGAMGASGPPLASFDMISNGLRSIEDERSGANEQRRVRAAFETDLLRLEVDRLKSGGSVRAGSGGMRNSAVGSRPASNPVLGSTPNLITSGRQNEVLKTANVGGILEVENNLTAGPVSVLGDSEPWGLDEVLIAVPQVIPQLAVNYGKKAGQWLATSDNSPLQGEAYAKGGRKPDGWESTGVFGSKPFWNNPNGSKSYTQLGNRRKNPLAVNIN